MPHPSGGNGAHLGMLPHTFNEAVLYIQRLKNNVIFNITTRTGAVNQITAITYINRRGITLIKFTHNYSYTVCEECWSFARNCEGEGVRIGHYTLPFVNSW